MTPGSRAEIARSGVGPAVAERCPNCGEPVVGEYCYRCGQKQEPRIVPLRALLAEWADDALSLDGRLLRTLGPMLLRPGRLTAEYLSGRRASYVPPLRLYLLASALYFVVIALSGSDRFFFFQASADSMQSRRFIQALPQLMFVILPLFALLLKVLHLGKGRYYVEHLVFALHYHAFAFLVLACHTLLDPLASAAFRERRFTLLTVPLLLGDGALQLAVVLYLGLALRRVYGRSWWLTALEAVALFFGYSLLLGLAADLLIGVMRLAPWLR
jgi:hypothetical protein